MNNKNNIVITIRNNYAGFFKDLNEQFSNSSFFEILFNGKLMLILITAALLIIFDKQFTALITNILVLNIFILIKASGTNALVFFVIFVMLFLFLFYKVKIDHKASFIEWFFLSTIFVIYFRYRFLSDVYDFKSYSILNLFNFYLSDIILVLAVYPI